MKAAIIKWAWLVGLFAGAVTGFLYWQQIGCVSGTCPITSSPYVSTLYGAGMGFLAAGIATPEKAGQKHSD